jgi:hypothetical protein
MDEEIMEVISRMMLRFVMRIDCAMIQKGVLPTTTGTSEIRRIPQWILMIYHFTFIVPIVTILSKAFGP